MSMMKAVLLKGQNKAELEEIPIPGCADGEILIRTKAATVCTSDILDMRHDIFSNPLPIVMGHEAAGIVEAVGSGVRDIKIGDEVAVHPVMPCYKCPSCKRGLPHLCDDMEHLCFNRPGVFAEFFTTRPDCVRKKPAGMSFAVASLMEPVCVCLEALNRAAIKEGDRILIAGDGPFGIMISKLAVSRKPKQIIQTGWFDSRLKTAASNGFVQTINAQNSKDIVQDIMKLTEGEGVDAAILCVSSQDALDACMEALCSRGILVIFSALNGKTPVDLMRVHMKELTITGSNNDENFMEDALRLLGDPELGLNKIVTHEIPFKRWQEAFHLAEHNKESCLKVSMIL